MLNGRSNSGSSRKSISLLFIISVRGEAVVPHSQAHVNFIFWMTSSSSRWPRRAKKVSAVIISDYFVMYEFHNRQDIGANQVELNAQVTGNSGNLVTIASELTEI